MLAAISQPHGSPSFHPLPQPHPAQAWFCCPGSEARASFLMGHGALEKLEKTEPAGSFLGQPEIAASPLGGRGEPGTVAARSCSLGQLAQHGETLPGAQRTPCCSQRVSGWKPREGQYSRSGSFPVQKQGEAQNHSGPAPQLGLTQTCIWVWTRFSGFLVRAQGAVPQPLGFCCFICKWRG
jgi:hypothetical protein